MIKKKKKICIECKEPKYIFSKKKCRECYIRTETKPLKSNTSLKKSSLKNKTKKETEPCLENYFKYHIIKCKTSDETGLPIVNPTKASICHVFPKRKYKSVQCDLRNCVYLTLQEHSQFDNLLDKHEFERLEKEFPNTWKKVKNIVQKILPDVKEEGRLKTALKNYLGI